MKKENALLHISALSRIPLSFCSQKMTSTSVLITFNGEETHLHKYQAI